MLAKGIGAVSSAASSAVRSNPFCRVNVTKTTPANESKPVTIPMMLPTVKVRSRNRIGSTSGWRPSRTSRRSTAKKPKKAGTAPTSSTSNHSGQPVDCPWISGKSTRRLARPRTTAPITSIEPVARAGGEGRSLTAAGHMTSPSGRNTTNAHRHPRPHRSLLINAPVMIWPSMNANAATVMNTAKARLRASPE